MEPPAPCSDEDEPRVFLYEQNWGQALAVSRKRIRNDQGTGRNHGYHGLLSSQAAGAARCAALRGRSAPTPYLQPRAAARHWRLFDWFVGLGLIVGVYRQGCYMDNLASGTVCTLRSVCSQKWGRFQPSGLQSEAAPGPDFV